MKTAKRSIEDRNYLRGYRAGVDGRSRDTCPTSNGLGRDSWMSGWRAGRAAAWDGLTGVSGIQNDPHLAH